MSRKKSENLEPFIEEVNLPAPVGVLLTELVHLTPRHRAFRLLKAEVDDYSRRENRFNPKEVQKAAITNAIRLTSFGAGEFDFDVSKQTGAPAICVYAREAGRCHNCLRARRSCLHPKGTRLSPFGRAKMRERGW